MKYKRKTANKHSDTSESIAHILNDNSDFNTVETYKSIRTNIMFSSPKQQDGGKVFAVSSSSPGEGKTTTCINIAITFAQMGARVIIVDGDLRKSRIHRYLGLPRLSGTSNVLCGYDSLEAAIKKDVRPNLDVLTSGEIPPNPAELLVSAEFSKMIEALRKIYDYVFIDTPPVTVVTDACVILKHTDGVILVSHQGVSTFDALDITVENIKTVGAKIIGMIMLGCDDRSKRYGYYSKKSYSYRYGYTYSYSYNDNKENDTKSK